MRRMLVLVGVLLAATPAWAQTPVPAPGKVEGSAPPSSDKPDTVQRVAAAEDGVFFIVALFPRDKLALSQAFLLRIAEFNAEYDYVKLGLDKTSLNIRLDTHAALLDAATFSALEGQTALAADEAYALIRSLLPPTSP